MTAQRLPCRWEEWCERGKHTKTIKKNAVLKCLKEGCVRGYFSDIQLNPRLKYTHSMYPSVEHLVSPKNHNKVVVETRIVNDMKSHLSEEEFWWVIEHLFAVGRNKGKIKSSRGKLLPKRWHPKRNYKESS